MKKILLIFFLFNNIGETSALPTHVDIIFLSSKDLVYLQNKIDGGHDDFFTSTLVAYNNSECIPMGDLCFDPQKGIMDKQGTEGVDFIQSSSAESGFKSINSLDIDLINCEPGNYFDIFCGAKVPQAEVKNSCLEIWTDISTSMRRIDSSKLDGQNQERCQRRSFIESIITSRPELFDYLYIFNTSLKQLGSYDTLCLNYGQNDTAKIIEWIDSAKVKNLFIITDIDELSLQLGDYLKKIKATIYGVGEKGMSIDALASLSGQIINRRCD